MCFGAISGIRNNYVCFRKPLNGICRKIDFEDEEQRRIKEGAETLLNLAGITTRKRKSSYTQDYELKKIKKEDLTSDTDYEKPTQFRPRLLRKKRDVRRLSNNNSIVQADDEWVKHRRELEINGNR